MTIKTGQAPVQEYIDELMDLIRRDKIRADDIITHRMRLDEASEAYDIFNKKDGNCLKVVMRP